MSSEPRVYIRHLRQAKLCGHGCRKWFKDHDINWSDFLGEGVPCSVLEATGQGVVDKPCAFARQEAENS